MILRTLFSVLFLVGSSIIFSGCAINYLTEDRSFNGSVKDSEAEISLRNALFQKDQNYFADVSVIVAEKRALLTGSVDSSESIDEIVTIVNKNSYITDVYNHLTVNSNCSIKDSSMDLFLNKKIFAALVSTEGVTSANYKTVVKDRLPPHCLHYGFDEQQQRKSTGVKGSTGSFRLAQSCRLHYHY